MMFSVPLFDLQTYIDTFTSYEFGLELIKMYSHPKYTSDVFNFTCGEYVKLYSED
jgi:hypothetical protein